MCNNVLPAYSSAKIVKIKRVFPELWPQKLPRFLMNHSVDVDKCVCVIRVIISRNTFNGLFSRATWVRQHHKSKTILDFNKPIKRRWAVASAGPCVILHLAADRSPPQHLNTRFLEVRCSSWRPTNSVKAHDVIPPHHTTTVLRPYIRDHPGEPVQGKINTGRHTDHPVGATPSGLTSAYFHHPLCNNTI